MLRLLPHPPSLVVTHPGYFRTVEANVAIHLALAIDFVFGSQKAHRLGAWRGVANIAPLPTWGTAHALVALVLVLGLYTRFKLLRAGLITTSVLCGAEAGSFLYGSLTVHPSTFVGATLLTYVAYMATVAYREPRGVVPVDLDGLK